MRALWIAALALAGCGSKAAPVTANGCAEHPQKDTGAVASFGGERGCSSFVTYTGRGVYATSHKVDKADDLFAQMGDRRFIDGYPKDQPLGVAMVAPFKAGGATYNLRVGIGGVPITAWIAPLSAEVVAGKHGYEEADDPAKPGAYADLALDGAERGAPGYDAKSGTVTFTTIDLTKRRFAGSFDVVFTKGSSELHVTGEFDDNAP